MPKFPTLFQYKIINILDSPAANIKVHFAPCIKWIKEAIDNGGCVLVHCFAGVSRSASVIIAYLMQECGMALAAATQHTKK
jgi:protein-tyrosine phosphatase